MGHPAGTPSIVQLAPGRRLSTARHCCSAHRRAGKHHRPGTGRRSRALHRAGARFTGPAERFRAKKAVADPLRPRAQPRGGRCESMKHVLITGAAGFIGTGLREQFAGRYRLRLTDVRTPPALGEDEARSWRWISAIPGRSRRSWREWTRWCTLVASRARTRGKRSGTSTSTERTTCSNPLAGPGSSGWSMRAACTRWVSIRAAG